ncbi:predicted protein [Botrytis cinerea T4]|uniref:Uncharacterized protein n=1 Tax=Botryotinia fuckeliana (strain T4) TaxID=999810 RepID=G2Y1E1_BOTF4|nr:predicted protein [Botrytis cinerea T4]
MASDQHRIGPVDQLNGQGNKILHAAKLPPNALPNAQVIPPSMNRLRQSAGSFARVPNRKPIMGHVMYCFPNSLGIRAERASPFEGAKPCKRFGSGEVEMMRLGKDATITS